MTSIRGAMCKIPVDEFISGTKIPYPLFVRIKDQKFIRFANQGDDLQIDRVKTLKERGLRYFYMEHEDYVRYTGIILSLARAIDDVPEIRAKRAGLLNLAGALLQEQIQIKELTAETKSQMSVFICDTVEALSQTGNLLDLFSSMAARSKTYFGDALMTGVCALLVCKGLKWESVKTKSRILFAALLHDIGEKELPEEILKKTRGQMSFSDRRILESHTVRGFDMLKSIPEIPFEVAQVALQHHEDCLGYGYPSGLKSAQISPLAKLISVADEFCVRLLGAGVREPTSGLAIHKQMIKEKGSLFESEYLEALETGLRASSR